AKLLLSKHGLTPGKDVNLVAVNGMPAILAALTGGKVEAGTMSPPTTVKANQAGFPKLASTVEEKVPLQQNMINLKKSYAAQHPEVVYAYLKAELEGRRDFLTKSDVAIAAIAKHTDSDQAT